MEGWGGNFLNRVVSVAGQAATVAGSVSSAAQKAWTEYKTNKRLFEPFEITQSTLDSGFLVISHPPGSLFGVYQEVANKTFHIILADSTSKKKFSIYRDLDGKKPAQFRDDLELHKHMFLMLGGLDKMTEKMAESVHSHRLWPTLHHACAIGCVQYIKMTPQAGSIVNSASQDGELCLHLACANGHADVVNLVLAHGADVSKQDVRRRNAFHYAAMGHPNIIKILVGSKSDEKVVNALDGDGHTPLVLAIFQRKVECVAALLYASASPTVLCQSRNALEIAVSLDVDPESLKCIETLVRVRPELLVIHNEVTGNTFLHSCRSKKVLMSLLAGLDLVSDLVNVLNKSGRTALHEYSACGYVECMVALLSFQADYSLLDEQGNSPLHLASMNASVDAIKTLLVFGADHKQKNVNGLTAMQVAKRDNIKALFVEFHNGASLASTREAAPRNQSDLDLYDYASSLARDILKNGKKCGKKYVNLLALDGGGIRGLILIQILLAIEDRLKVPIMNNVHWMGGTSTGAILAIALSTGKTLRQMQRIYFKFKDLVFEGSRPYDAAKLETFLKDHLGVSTSMEDVKQPKLYITAVNAEKTPTRLHAFRNYKLPVSAEENLRLGFEDPKDQLLWKAARASSAAPTYFKCAEGKLVDGGLMANNPTLDLLTEISMHNLVLKREGIKSCEIGCVLSVGCGIMPDKGIDNLDVSLPDNFIDAVFQGFAVKTLATMLVDHITAADGRPVDRARGWCHSAGAVYFRFSPPLKQDICLDCTDDILVVHALWQTMLYMNNQSNNITSLVDAWL